MKRALTREQQKLVEDNHNLIYFVINKIGLDKEEYYGVAAIGLCKAATLYEPGKNQFSTFACHVIKNWCLSEAKKQNALKRSKYQGGGLGRR